MKGKKLASFIIVGFIAVICLFVILSAIVPKNFSFELDEPSRIELLNISTGAESYEKDSEEYNEIMKLFNKGFKVSFLEAFFQGKGFNKVSTLEKTQYINSLSASDTTYIRFYYNEAKQVNLHGDKNLNLTSNEEKYKSVVFEIKQSNSLISINAYLINDGYSENYSYVRYVSYAKMSELYDYLNENFEF